MRPVLLPLVAIALMVGACGGDDAGGTTTTDARGAAAPTPSSTAPTATVAPSCPEVLSPTGPDVVERQADVDGDGLDDQLFSFLSDGDEAAPPLWTIIVALAAGGGASLDVPGDGLSGVVVLGGADVDGDGADEVWARTGQGASATILGLARFADCRLTRVSLASGEPAQLPVGGSVGTASGLACEAHVDPTADVTGYTATNTGGDQYEITATEYALEGTVLVPTGTQAATATVGDEAFARATSFTCGDLSL